MYALRSPSTAFPRITSTSAALDVDDSIVFVAQAVKIQTLRRTSPPRRRSARVNVAVSRLPHPASIGMLALGKAIGGKFNLVPYGGGNPTRSRC